MELAARVGVYPEKGFAFWKNETPEITIINPGDFPKKEILEGIGVDPKQTILRFGNCDGAEAKERIEIMKFLHARPKITRQIADLRAETNKGLPSEENDFTSHFDPKREHNPFWESVHAFLQATEPKENEKIPKRIQIFRDTLESFLELEIDERQMANAIGEILASIAVFEGIAEITFAGGDTYFRSPMISSFECHGHQIFSFSLSEKKMLKYPKWLKKEGWGRKFFGNWLCDFVLECIDFRNQCVHQEAQKTMVFDDSDDLREDITEGMKTFLQRNEEVKAAIKDFTHEFFCEEIAFEVYFSYGKKGERSALELMIFDIQCSPSLKHQEPDCEEIFNLFEGYSKERMQRILKSREGIFRKLQDILYAKRRYKLVARIMEGDPNFFSRRFSILSPRTDFSHKWRALENVYHMDDFLSVYEAMKEFYKFVCKNSDCLLQMDCILRGVERKAQELRTRICFPEILDSGENVIIFDELYPLHLPRETKEVVPISGLPALNGTMIGLTGRHGGGKTVTEHTIGGNIFLALSGVPTLGNKFQLNPKTHLGMVFIEGIAGASVCQVLVRKIEKVFAGIQNVPGKNIVLVLDELGSATQESAGMKLALRVLEKLQKHGISLIFSTQIIGVAEEAEKLFGAACFRVDKKRRLLPGIADGELDQLVREEGLAKWLDKK